MKKSEIFNLTEEEFDKLVNDIKDIFIEHKEVNMGEVIQNKILPKYKDTKEYLAAGYLSGEVVGKCEMGMDFLDFTFNAVQKLKLEIDREVDLTDELLRKHKERTVN